MKFACMTSMHQAYFDHIGNHMIESYKTYWPKDIPLYLYAENMDYNDPSGHVITVDWNETCRKNWKTFAIKSDDSRAHRFGKKAYASMHGWRNVDADFIIWLDADMLFQKQITEEVLQKTLSESQLVGLFDNDYQRIHRGEEPVRTKWSAESGYVIVNKKHKNFKQFVDRYQEIYDLPKKPEEITNWWDNETLMLSAKDFISEVHDLSQYRTTNKTQTPLNKCFLADYMSHFKGKSKKRREQTVFTEYTKV